jgi:proline iminopeptidase
MAELYPDTEPYERGFLDASAGNRIYWELCGAPGGKAAVVLHGGPGSGCTPWHRRLFDPQAYRAVLFDQRGCGRSLPHAGDITTGLGANTTDALIADIDALRQRLEIDRWLVLGGSWGSTLALAYAERHPEHVTELVLFGVTTGRHKEFDWWFRGGASVHFPAQWDRLRAALPPPERDGDVVEAYHRLLHDPNPGVRRRAATEWCRWESATLAWPPEPRLAPRFADPAYAMAFARLVTHYVSHNAWLEDGVLLRGAGTLSGIPGIMVQGRLDFGAPIAWAWELKQVWPHAELVVVADAGHAGDHPGIAAELVRATDRFAAPR